MACCSNPEMPIDEVSLAENTEASTDVSGSNDDTDILQTTYLNVTPLFRAIEKEDWEGILMFMNTSRWSNHTSLWQSSASHLKSPAPHLQARTWVTSYDTKGREEWSQLPLHAAISYSAPPILLQKLVELYPGAVKCRDNEGMLPVHLAFGFGSPDPVLAMLLKTYPGSVLEPGPEGRLSYECCELGPNKVRGEVFSIVATETAVAAVQDHEAGWKNMYATQTERLALEDESNDKQLTLILKELLEDRKQLRDLKQKLKGTYGTKNILPISTSRGMLPKNQTSPKSNIRGRNGSSPRSNDSLRDKPPMSPTSSSGPSRSSSKTSGGKSKKSTGRNRNKKSGLVDSEGGRWSKKFSNGSYKNTA